MPERKQIKVEIDVKVIYTEKGESKKEEFTESTVVIDDSPARAGKMVGDSIKRRETERYGKDLESITFKSVSTLVLEDE